MRLITCFPKVLLLLALCAWPWTTIVHAQLNAQTGPDFDGSDNTSTYVTPADTDGCIGPNHFVEFINGNFAVYNKSDGSEVLRITDSEFWSNSGPGGTNTGINFAPSDSVSDPRVIYDPASQHWFASQVRYDGSASDPTLESDYYLLGVSDTPDPTGSWHVFAFLADPGSGKFADFPTLGVDANAVYLGGDMYYGMDNDLGSSLTMIPKSDLVNGSPTIANRVYFGTFTNRGAVMQPVSCFDGTSAGNVLAAGDFSNSAQVIVSPVLNSGTAGAALAAPVDVAVAAYTAPLDAWQPDGTKLIAVNDARFSARVYAVGGIIYAAHNIEVNNRAAIRWYRLDATNYAVLESGTITDTNLDLYYPSIAANTNGAIVIGCNGSSQNTPISAFAYGGLTVSNVTTFGDKVLLATGGSGSYHDLYEQSALSPDSRWGDYSTTTVDPADPNHFWTIQLVPLADGSTWITHITELTVSPQLPSLTISVVGETAIVSWPTWADGFQLQANGDLGVAGAWATVPQSPVMNGSTWSVTVPATATKQFFRLLK